MSEIRRRRGVDDDIFELAAYLLDRSPEAAYRFVDAVERTLKDLASRPGLGSRKEFADPSLAEVRSWWVTGFPNQVIYYVPMEDGIDVLAVLHGARDVQDVLERRV